MEAFTQGQMSHNLLTLELSFHEFALDMRARSCVGCRATSFNELALAGSTPRVWSASPRPGCLIESTYECFPKYNIEGGDGRVKRPADSFNPFIRLETLIGSAVAPVLPTHCLHTY